MNTSPEKQKPNLSAQALGMFTGTQKWFRHSMVRRITYTEGAKYVADQAGAYWLLDEIAFAQIANKEVAHEGFQVWKLAVDQEAHTAMLTVEDGNDNEVYQKKIDFTDFPEDKIELWFTNDVIMLPSEY